MATSQTKALFTAGHPILNVKNVVASLEYYCGKLGFKHDFVWPPCVGLEQPNPTFAQVSRGKVTVMLAQENQGGPGMWIYVDVATLEDFTTLHLEYLASGVKISEPPVDKPWNMREM